MLSQEQVDEVLGRPCDIETPQYYHQMVRHLVHRIRRLTPRGQAVFGSTIMNLGMMHTPWYVRIMIGMSKFILWCRRADKRLQRNARAAYWSAATCHASVRDSLIDSVIDHMHNGTDAHGRAKYGGFHERELLAIRFIVNSVEEGQAARNA